MSVVEKKLARERVFNVPNQLSALRLVLSIVLFVLMATENYLSGMAVFLVAAGTDWLDGYWARKYGQITTLGRILDPFVDKIIICGAFIFLVAEPGSGVKAWMAVVVVGRELLVTALRNFLEGEGADFSAKMSGKLKMVLQCAAVLTCLYSLAYVAGGNHTLPDWLRWTRDVTIWAAVALTLYSGVEYILRAIEIARRMRLS